MPTTLRITEGPEKGTEFPVGLGDIIIGRGAKATVKVASPDASWEHAIITRQGEDWMIENLSAHGTQLNDTKISGRVRLRPRDRIRITDDTVLRFDTTEGPQVSVLANPWLVRTLAAGVVLIILTWAYFILTEKAPVPPNYQNAYNHLISWMREEVKDERMTVEMVLRLEQARSDELNALADTTPSDRTATSFKRAAMRYQDILVMLDGMEEKYHFMQNAADKPAALTGTVMTLPADAPNPDSATMAAALAEFVRSRLDYCNGHAGSK